MFATAAWISRGSPTQRSVRQQEGVGILSCEAWNPFSPSPGCHSAAGGGAHACRDVSAQVKRRSPPVTPDLITEWRSDITHRISTARHSLSPSPPLHPSPRPRLHSAAPKCCRLIKLLHNALLSRCIVYRCGFITLFLFISLATALCNTFFCIVPAVCNALCSIKATAWQPVSSLASFFLSFSYS